MAYPTPPVPELARAEGNTVSQLTDWFVAYLKSSGCPWSYRSGIRSIKAAYKGLHRLDQLMLGAGTEKLKQARISNSEIISHAAPFAFGRSTQVFDLPARKFSFGRDRHAGYRIPFFFVESGVVHLYYVQPRKGHAPDFEQLGMTATIHKRYLLDTEFFGLPVDLEYVDLGAPDGVIRAPKKYSLSNLDIWSERRLTERLTLISSALDRVDEIEVQRARRHPKPEPDMPLFD